MNRTTWTPWITEMFDANDRALDSEGTKRDYEVQRRKRVTAMAICFFQDLVMDARSKVDEFNRQLCRRMGVAKDIGANPSANRIEFHVDRLAYTIELDVNAETITTDLNGKKIKYAFTLRDGASELDIKRVDGEPMQQDFTIEVLATFFKNVLVEAKRWQ